MKLTTPRIIISSLNWEPHVNSSRRLQRYNRSNIHQNHIPNGSRDMESANSLPSRRTKANRTSQERESNSKMDERIEDLTLQTFQTLPMLLRLLVPHSLPEHILETCTII
ncbi:hypothetical protein V6N13_117898 [Hibiscus sabdariffa]